MKALETLIENIISVLADAGETITFAESCTGGRIAAALTAVPGSSAVFNGSVVSYANTIKAAWLGVRTETLAQHGAVSRACVQEMLSGALDMAQADHAIAVSGIAGPSGGTKDKPVGTVYIGIKTPAEETIYHLIFDGDRHAVQEQSVAFAIRTLGTKLGIEL